MEAKLTKIGIKRNISGWFNVRKFDDIIKFLMKVDDGLRNPSIKTEDGDFTEASVDDYTIYLFKNKDGSYSCHIDIKNHSLGVGHGNYYEAIASAVMSLNGYDGVFTPSKIHEIREYMNEQNLEYSDYFNNQWDG